MLRIEQLACVIRRAMLCAAPALDAGEGLQSHDIRDIFARVQTEVFVADQRRYATETAARQEDRSRAQQQMQDASYAGSVEEIRAAQACVTTNWHAPPDCHADRNAYEARYVTISARISPVITAGFLRYRA